MEPTQYWTTAILQALSPLCLTAKLPWQLALLVPTLFIVDLYYRAQTPRREPVRAAIGQEKRKVRRLNGKGADITTQQEFVRFMTYIELMSRSPRHPAQDGAFLPYST
jgi:hypothetical protein